ncbi:MAG: hypothetical protein FWD74_07525, partial [Actinomycetia bacterium]|nr:hypothetical protein [Actinomycetes bacterium]
MSLLDQPDPEQSRWELILWTCDDLIWYGYSVWLVLSRYVSGRPAAMRRLLHGTFDLAASTVDGYPVPPEDLIRINGPHEGLLSWSGCRTLGAALEIEQS